MPTNSIATAPAFVQVAPDTTELCTNGRILGVTFGYRSGEVALTSGAAGLYSSLRLSRAEAQALAAELQRVLCQPSRVAA